MVCPNYFRCAWWRSDRPKHCKLIHFFSFLFKIAPLKNNSPFYSYHFLLGPSSLGLLFLYTPLDYETQRFHRLTVRAVDHGLPSLSSTQTITVEVGDVNDQSPVFDQNIYNASVAENRDPGEPVVRVSATDEDSGNNYQLFLSSCGFDYLSWLSCLCQIKFNTFQRAHV